MKVYVIRVQNPKGNYWVMTNDDASTVVETGDSKKEGLAQLERVTGQTITRIIRFQGTCRASEAAMTIADIREGRAD